MHAGHGGRFIGGKLLVIGQILAVVIEQIDHDRDDNHGDKHEPGQAIEKYFHIVRWPVRWCNSRLSVADKRRKCGAVMARSTCFMNDKIRCNRVCHPVHQGITPVFGQQQAAILAVREIAHFDQNRWHLRRLQHPEAGKAVGAAE